MSAETLDLDEGSLSPDQLSTGTLMRELGLQRRPSWVLRKLMNSLEQRRQAKGLGWSRSWNKRGLNVFRTHVHEVAADADYFIPLQPLMDRFLPKAPDLYREFALELLADPKRMAFTFYHNHDSGDAQFEGLTVCIGRRVPDDATKRDRLDVILEDRRTDGEVDGTVDRLRIYLCPWAQYRNEKAHFLYETSELTGDELDGTQALYKHCVEKYHQWKDPEARQWNHWSARYIDYFGPRSFIPVGTSFS